MQTLSPEPTSQSLAVQASAAKRTRVAQIRADLRTGRRTLGEVLGDPPEEIGYLTVFEVLLMGRGVGRAMLADFATRALANKINLGMPIERTAPRTRAWLAANAPTVNHRTGKAFMPATTRSVW